ncbi:hypothetical protein ES708_05743 [subsurface metagenome]
MADSFYALIGGVEVKLARNSLMVDQRVEERSIAEFTVLDKDGLKHYQKGEPVLIYDLDDVLVWAGVIDVPEERSMND